MTQAFNLSQLANKVNSSGQLDGTTGLTTSVVTNTLGSQAATALTLQSAGTTALTIDTSQNVGIGTTTTTFTYTGSSTTTAKQAISTSGYDCLNLISTGAVPTLDFSQPNSASTIFRYAAIGGTLTTTTAGSESGALTFSTSNAGANVAERMRIDSSGNLLVGRTSKQADIASQPTNVQSSTGYSCYDGTNQAAFTPTRIYFNGANFYVLNASDTGVKLVNGSTSWTTQSDERTKTNLVPILNALQKVNTLRTVTGRYLNDEENVSRAFLIAQDVKAVLPEAVDEENDEQKTLGLRYTEVIPLLVAAIKEQQALIQTIQTQVAQLQAKVGT